MYRERSRDGWTEAVFRLGCLTARTGKVRGPSAQSVQEGASVLLRALRSRRKLLAAPSANVGQSILMPIAVDMRSDSTMLRP